jgi:hypothetical protein
MIRKIEFNNFYSFKDNQVIDFTTSKKNSEVYFTTFDDKQITKVMGVIGPNNSGKTNVTKLFGFLKYFLTEPERSKSDAGDTGYKCYEFYNNKKTKIKVEFETDHYLCLYDVELSSNEVFNEMLQIRKLKKYSKYVTAFSREKDVININKSVIKGVTQRGLSSIKKDVSVVAFIKANYNEKLITEISSYFEEYWTNVNEGGFVFTPEDRTSEVAEIYRQAPELKGKVEEFIKNFDLGIEGFNIIKSDKKISVEAIHKINGKEYSLPIHYESRGTKSLFVDLLHILICTNFHGRSLIVDEIEMGLHPEAVNKIVQFVIENFSKKKRQFIFASHTFDFLKKFDAQQVCLVEKKDNKSEIYRLDELEVRTDDNYYKKYLSGAYGAYPDISL